MSTDHQRELLKGFADDRLLAKLYIFGIPASSMGYDELRGLLCYMLKNSRGTGDFFTRRVAPTSHMPTEIADAAHTSLAPEKRP